MKFPTMIYFSPGPHQCPGGTFGYLSIKAGEELVKAVRGGEVDYYPSPELAVEKPVDFDWGDYVNDGRSGAAEESDSDAEAGVEKLVMVHRGRGKYDVYAGTTVVMDNVTKEDAEAAGAVKATPEEAAEAKQG